MKTPKAIEPLIEDGLVDEVLRPLMSGKEAIVYLVRCGDEIRCAKVYKDIAVRTFKKAVQYQEGRKVRNTRRQRAMEKGSRFGRDEQEKVWQNAEVEALYRLKGAGVRVPEAYGCFDGVLLMELITDAAGEVAPRLNDVAIPVERAAEDHATMMRYVLRMLCVGVVHGDLSEFNVLMAADGPVIIDLPQAVDAAGNNSAPTMLARDVANITRYYAQYVPAACRDALRGGAVGAVRGRRPPSRYAAHRHVRARREPCRCGLGAAADRGRLPRGDGEARAIA